MNLLEDASFELTGSPAWAFYPADGAMRDGSTVHSGDYSAKLQIAYLGDDDLWVQIGGHVTQSIVLDIGTYYPLSLWVFGEQAGLADLLVEVDEGSGSYRRLGLFPNPQEAGWHEWHAGTMIPTAVNCNVRIRCGFVPSHHHGDLPVPTWYVDDITLDGLDSEWRMREQIRSALLAKLQTISTGNGYLSTIGTVTEDRRYITDYGNYPALVLRPLGGQQLMPAGTNFRKTMRHAFWTVFMFVEAEDDGQTALTNLLRDVTKAVCIDQTLGGLDFLGWHDGPAVGIVSDGPWEVPADLARGYQAWSCEIRTTYQTGFAEI